MKRRELPLIHTCGVIGTLWAICWALVNRQQEFDRTRVTLDQSLPPALAGFVVGVVVGVLFNRVVMTWPHLTRIVEAVLIPTLVASTVAPLGWLFRDDRFDWSGEEAITRAGSIGFAVGVALYVFVRVLQFVSGTKILVEPNVTTVHDD
jgi:hypothetical protein